MEYLDYCPLSHDKPLSYPCANTGLQKEFREILKIEAWRIKFTKAVKANCWYIGDSESEAMWKLYVANDDGVTTNVHP
ncbi:MAG: hypothetical protein SV062_12020 [Thermodesulfobacteriota bacterium]|nr:hypothetical protein [Thermodesulfobacteriota bacterium]